MSETIEFYVDGEVVSAENGVTIIDAMIKAGKHVVGHVGCKGGACGACTCIVRREDGKSIPALACRTLAENGMRVSFPKPDVRPVKYVLEQMPYTSGLISELYPEIYNCVTCGKCTKNCVKGIDVRLMIENAKYGDLKKVADISFSCIGCGACSFGCPAKINHAEVGLLARRFYAKYLAPKTGSENK